ncbi:MAG: prepilin-type N-terminal cleavage/methylation domain-containing protein [Syntrophales bacterium]|nr:prepilin-type N-terminal cleavage/methylation domain-containing protein [Syntrophales bacterium]
MPWKVRKIEGGFTLVEILIAVLILGVALSTVYLSYTGIFRMTREVSTENEQLSTAHIFFTRLESDLGRLVPYNGNYEFFCRMKEIEEKKFPVLFFRSSAFLQLMEKEQRGGIAGIVYEVAKDNEGVLCLWRKEMPVSRSLTLLKKIVGGFRVCEEVKSISYIFYDASGKAYEEWDTSSGPVSQKGKLPAAVYIKLEVADKSFGKKIFLTPSKIAQGL